MNELWNFQKLIITDTQKGQWVQQYQCYANISKQVDDSPLRTSGYNNWETCPKIYDIGNETQKNKQYIL